MWLAQMTLITTTVIELIDFVFYFYLSYERKLRKQKFNGDG